MKKKNNEEYELKQSLKGVLGFAMYFVLSWIITIIPALVGIDYNAMPINIKQIYLICFCLIEMLLFFLLYKDEVINGFKDLKKNIKPYFKKYFKAWLVALAVMYLNNLAIAVLRYRITGDLGVASNEQNIRDTLAVAPFYVFMAASIYAPFVEELTFRHSFRKIFKNDIVFLIVSSFVFGGLHVFGAGMTWFDLLYLIPYCAPGVAFAYIYLKTNNITSTISLHLCHNTILMILQVILLSKGLL